jgi:hypothetical protein
MGVLGSWMAKVGYSPALVAQRPERQRRIQTVVAQGKGPLAAAARDSPLGGGGLEKEGEADL